MHASRVYVAVMTALMGAMTACKSVQRGQAAEVKVSGGETTAAYPSVVRIDYAGGPCTGTVVHRRAVLTAAHCVRNVSLANLQGAELAAAFAVTVGEERLVPTSGWVHPRFANPDMGAFTNVADFQTAWFKASRFDVAVLIFDRDLPAEIVPVGGPAPALNTDVEIVGFGASEYGGRDFAKRAAVTRVTRAQNGFLEILRAFRKDPGLTGDATPRDDNQPAAGTNGDSGGPMLLDGRVVGITSWGALFGKTLRARYVDLSGPDASEFLRGIKVDGEPLLP